MFDINDENIPDWERKMLAEQGFAGMFLPVLKRKKGDGNEYYVYSDKDEFKSIEADTAVIAMEKSELPNPYKVVPAHKRIKDVVQNEELEYVENKLDSATNNAEVPEGESESHDAGEQQAEAVKPAEETPPPADG